MNQLSSPVQVAQPTFLFLVDPVQKFSFQFSALRNELQKNLIKYQSIVGFNQVTKLMNQRYNKNMIVIDSTNIDRGRVPKQIFDAYNNRIYFYPNRYQSYMHLPTPKDVVDKYRQQTGNPSKNSISLRCIKKDLNRQIRAQSQRQLYNRVNIIQPRRNNPKYEKLLNALTSMKKFSVISRQNEVDKRGRSLLILDKDNYENIDKFIISNRLQQNIELAILGQVKGFSSKKNGAIMTQHPLQIIQYLQQSGFNMSAAKSKFQSQYQTAMAGNLDINNDLGNYSGTFGDQIRQVSFAANSAGNSGGNMNQNLPTGGQYNVINQAISNNLGKNPQGQINKNNIDILQGDNVNYDNRGDMNMNIVSKMSEASNQNKQNNNNPNMINSMSSNNSNINGSPKAVVKKISKKPVNQNNVQNMYSSKGSQRQINQQMDVPRINVLGVNSQGSQRQLDQSQQNRYGNAAANNRNKQTMKWRVQPELTNNNPIGGIPNFSITNQPKGMSQSSINMINSKKNIVQNLPNKLISEVPILPGYTIPNEQPSFGTGMGYPGPLPPKYVPPSVNITQVKPQYIPVKFPQAPPNSNFSDSNNINFGTVNNQNGNLLNNNGINTNITIIKNNGNPDDQMMDQIKRHEMEVKSRIQELYITKKKNSLEKIPELTQQYNRTSTYAGDNNRDSSLGPIRQIARVRSQEGAKQYSQEMEKARANANKSSTGVTNLDIFKYLDKQNQKTHTANYNTSGVPQGGTNRVNATSGSASNEIGGVVRIYGANGVSEVSRIGKEPIQPQTYYQQTQNTINSQKTITTISAANTEQIVNKNINNMYNNVVNNLTGGSAQTINNTKDVSAKTLPPIQISSSNNNTTNIGGLRYFPLKSSDVITNPTSIPTPTTSPSPITNIYRNVNNNTNTNISGYNNANSQAYSNTNRNKTSLGGNQLISRTIGNTANTNPVSSPQYAPINQIINNTMSNTNQNSSQKKATSPTYTLSNNRTNVYSTSTNNNNVAYITNTNSRSGPQITGNQGNKNDNGYRYTYDYTNSYNTSSLRNSRNSPAKFNQDNKTYNEKQLNSNNGNSPASKTYLNSYSTSNPTNSITTYNFGSRTGGQTVRPTINSDSLTYTIASKEKSSGTIDYSFLNSDRINQLSPNNNVYTAGFNANTPITSNNVNNVQNRNSAIPATNTYTKPTLGYVGSSSSTENGNNTSTYMRNTKNTNMSESNASNISRLINNFNPVPPATTINDTTKEYFRKLGIKQSDYQIVQVDGKKIYKLKPKPEDTISYVTGQGIDRYKSAPKTYSTYSSQNVITTPRQGKKNVFNTQQMQQNIDGNGRVYYTLKKTNSITPRADIVSPSQPSQQLMLQSKTRQSISTYNSPKQTNSVSININNNYRPQQTRNINSPNKYIGSIPIQSNNNIQNPYAYTPTATSTNLNKVSVPTGLSTNQTNISSNQGIQLNTYNAPTYKSENNLSKVPNYSQKYEHVLNSYSNNNINNNAVIQRNLSGTKVIRSQEVTKSIDGKTRILQKFQRTQDPQTGKLVQVNKRYSVSPQAVRREAVYNQQAPNMSKKVYEFQENTKIQLLNDSNHKKISENANLELGMSSDIETLRNNLKNRNDNFKNIIQQRPSITNRLQNEAYNAVKQNRNSLSQFNQNIPGDRFSFGYENNFSPQGAQNDTNRYSIDQSMQRPISEGDGITKPTIFIQNPHERSIQRQILQRFPGQYDVRFFDRMSEIKQRSKDNLILLHRDADNIGYQYDRQMGSLMLLGGQRGDRRVSASVHIPTLTYLFQRIL